MMRLMLLILLISANCMNMNCDEESSTNTSEVSEKTEILSADPESLQSETKNIETKDEVSKVSEDDEEIRVSRSSSSLSTKNETQVDDSSKVHISEKSISGEVIGEIASEVAKEVREPKDKANSIQASQDDANSEKLMEKLLEDLPETSRSAPESEDIEAEDVLEASAENKLSDNEKNSSKVDETYRNSETEKITEESDESGFDGSVETRRMLSGPDYIVLDTKTRADTTSNSVVPEGNTALKQNLNTYNFNEFGTNRHNKLIDSSTTETYPYIVKTTMPVITKPVSQEIFNQQYFPKFYPRHELNMNFPNLNSDFQGPHDLPINLKVKQDEVQLRSQLIGSQNSQFKSAEENTYFNPRNQEWFHQPQKMLNPTRATKTQFQDFRLETSNQVPRFFQNHVSTDFQIEDNKQLTKLNQGSRTQGQHVYQNQEKINSDYKSILNLNSVQRNQMQGMLNSKMPLINNEQENQYTLLNQPQDVTGSDIDLENKQFGRAHLANPYLYLHPPDRQQINDVNFPRRYDIIPTKIKILFQKLASASEYPRMLHTNLYSNNNIQNYPYLIHPFNRADSSLYDHRYVSGFQQHQ